MRPIGAIHKAVFPVGGFGTELLPATKAAPKELLPVVDKPLIHYAVEEALRAGVRQMIFVTSRTKRAIEDHFDKAYELESELARQHRDDLLAELRRLFPPDVTYQFVRQPEPRGLGHAIACAQVLVGGEPFLVIISDELLDAPVPAALQLVNAFRRWGEPLVGTAVAADGSSPAAWVEGVDIGPRMSRVTRIRGAAAPSAAPVAGRFVLGPRIFDFLKTTPPRASGEVELTDALASMLATEPVLARDVEGVRFDCGAKLGYLAATLHFGLRHPALGEAFAALVHAVAAERIPSARAAGHRPRPTLYAAND
jgi:UTP--glucose-1-phosphate uridylyltransferase